MTIWDPLRARPVGFLATGAIALALGSTGCSLFDHDSTAETAPTAVATGVSPELLSKPLMTYKVEKGDSLWKLARDYQTTVQEIRAANSLEGDLIRAGDTILIPTDHADRQVSGETGRVVADTSASREAAPASITPGAGTQPIQDAPTTPPSQADPAPDSPVKRSAPPPTTSEELRSANIRYFSNRPESGKQ